MKNLLNLGRALNKTEQKQISGGRRRPPEDCTVDSNIDCTGQGNAACTIPGEGCFIQNPDSNLALCQCI